MKIYISTDLEGATGVFKFRQTREKETPEFKDAIRLLMGDIAAVADGLRAAGADEIYAMDGHNGGNNFIPDCMAAGVQYITGWPRGGGFAGLDRQCSGVILLGYHAMKGTPDGVLNHTQSSTNETKYIYDNIERGEIYQSAVVAGAFNVPVMLVTGDEATCREARATLGDDLTTVAVKKGLGRESAILLAPEDARRLLREGARQAVAALALRKPYNIKLPIHCKISSIDPRDPTNATPRVIEREIEISDPLKITG